MQIRVHGLALREGDTSFAFLVLRLAAPVDRDGLIDLIGQLAILVPDAPRFATEIPHDCDAAMRLVGIPWAPPADAAVFKAQREAIEGAGVHGIAEAWFFQTGTCLPAVAPDPDADDADLDDDDLDDDDESGDADESDDHDAEGDDEDAPELLDETWSHGPPPQLAAVSFPVDGYPEILEDLDWEDFGIAVKLAGPWSSGETTVLLGFHAMWLTPYGGRYRTARVTIDPVHHAAHFWVDRFAVPCSPQEQVHHLLWIVSKLDEVTPVVHARFAGATMGEKYGDLAGDLREAFVLGGNPLLAVHAREGDAGIDAWIAGQTTWSSEEIAPMLRELAIDLVTRRAPEPVSSEADEDEDDFVDDEEDEEDDDDEEDEGDDVIEEDEDDDDVDEDDDEEDDEEDEEDEEDEDEEDDDEEEDDEEDEAEEEDEEDDEDDEDHEEPTGDVQAVDAEDTAARPRARQLTAYVGELLTTRAYLGKLDRRAADHLRPALAAGAKYEHRRTAIVSILGGLRDRDSVPAMIRILETTPIASALDAIGKEDLVAATARALGMIADPRAIPALTSQVIVPGPHNDEPRLPAALALSACIAASSNPPELPAAVFDALLRNIRDLGDDEPAADLRVAYNALATRLPPARRDRALLRLHAVDAELPTPGRSAVAPRFDDEDDTAVN